ncbi:MAG: hypothetical protein ACHWZW_13750 [Spirulina sp.]
MNSHDAHNPDFPQEIPAIPDAEMVTSPEELSEAESLGEVGQTDAFPEPAALDSEMNAVVEGVMASGTDPASAMDSTAAMDPALERDPLDVESSVTEAFQETSALDPESAIDPLTVEPSVTEAFTETSAEAPTSEAPVFPVQAAEVWTELDEAEPAAMTADRPRDTKPAAASWAGTEEEGEPDPSVLDAGSRPRREAEKPGRTVLPYDDWEPSEVPYQPKELGVIDQLMIVLADGATIWRKVLRQVRSWLPRTWQRNLSDELMTAIALGVLILWLVLWNPLGSKGTSPKVAVENPEIPGPALSQGDDKAGTSAILSRNSGESVPAIATETPTEALEPSPEQTLIADIQERVSKISRSYAVGLIQSVEVNLPQQVLAVNVSQDWYGLGAESQDRIAQDIYSQAQGLAFATLQLRDPDGVIVARNPVVGPAMVILKRHRPTEGDPLA